MKKLINKYRGFPVQVRAGFWFLICTIIQRSISIITTPVFTRMLTTNEYGKYSVFISWMGILTCFVTMYIFSGVYPPTIVKFEGEKEKYSSAMQGLTLCLVFVWLVVYIIFRNYWNTIIDLNTDQMIAMFIAMWTTAIFGFWSTEQRFEYKYRKLVLVTLLEAILQPALCVILIILNKDRNKVSGLVWGIALATFISYFPLFVDQMKRGKTFFSGKIWRYSLGFAIPLIPHYISTIILNSSDRIMIQHLVGEEQAGIYNLAYTVSICGVLINQAILQTLSPWIYQKIHARQFDDIKKAAYPCLVGIASINLLVVLFAPEIIKVFAPAEYYDAIWVMPPIVLSVFFMFSYNLFCSFEFYYEKKSYVSTATMVGAVLNIILNFVFIKEYGYYAAGYTTLFCYITFAVAHYFFMMKICKKELQGIVVYNAKNLVLISSVFIAIGFSIMVLYKNSIMRYGLSGIIILFLVIMRKKLLKFISPVLGIRKTDKEFSDGRV